MQFIQNEKNRDYSFDNLRAFLIICVVYAHLLENCSPFFLREALYQVIYSFHMPVFLFICGYFAKYDKNKLLFGLFFSYLMLQTAYVFFQRWLYGKDVLLQYTTPYWVLWFLLALFLYYLLLPLYDVDSVKKRTVAWIFVLLLSFVSGYDSTVGYSMTLSRLLVFQPWFLLGFYVRRTKLSPMPMAGKILTALLLGVCIVILRHSSITKNMLYGSYPYVKLQYHAGIRAFLAFVALLWILFFHCVIRPFVNIRIPLITALGQNTLSVFLLHGFIVKYIGYCHPQLLDTPTAVIAITCIILFVTGNSATSAVFCRLLPDYWVRKRNGSRSISIKKPLR